MEEKKEEVLDTKPEVNSNEQELHLNEEVKTPSKKEEKKLKKDRENALLEQIKKLEEENKALVEKVKIAQADAINYRRRKDEETAQMLKFANQDLIMELIPLVDNFERALKVDESQMTAEVSKFLTGFKMMHTSLIEILKKFGVEEINRVGEKFDPSQEQALVAESVPEMEDEVVIEVLLKGYKLKDRVIRPASVKINQI